MTRTIKSVERNNDVRGISDFIQEIHCWTWTIKSVERNNEVRGIFDFIQEIHCWTWTIKSVDLFWKYIYNSL